MYKLFINGEYKFYKLRLELNTIQISRLYTNTI